jgi:hypothetical protein
MLENISRSRGEQAYGCAARGARSKTQGTANYDGGCGSCGNNTDKGQARDGIARHRENVTACKSRS